MIQLYNLDKGTMQVAGLMSGSGTNLQKIIDNELEIQTRDTCPYHVAVIFTDNVESNAVNIGRKYNIPVVVRDIKSFYRNKGKPLKDLIVREEFDAETVKALSPFNISVAAYAGYMSIATKPLIDAFLGVNVHPADLSLKNPDGTRKYTGDHAVRDAILAGEAYLRSTTHIIERKVDYGKILMISEPVRVVRPLDFNKNDPAKVEAAEKLNQSRLKEYGDWMIFPRTILEIARGRFMKDDCGRLYYDEKVLLDGVRLADLRI
ncbi:MAG: formyltransferase family protein [Candidatus Woesearchaeota archaeon]